MKKNYTYLLIGVLHLATLYSCLTTNEAMRLNLTESKKGDGSKPTKVSIQTGLSQGRYLSYYLYMLVFLPLAGHLSVNNLGPTQPLCNATSRWHSSSQLPTNLPGAGVASTELRNLKKLHDFEFEFNNPVVDDIKATADTKTFNFNRPPLDKILL